MAKNKLFGAAMLPLVTLGLLTGCKLTEPATWLPLAKLDLRLTRDVDFHKSTTEDDLFAYQIANKYLSFTVLQETDFKIDFKQEEEDVGFVPYAIHFSEDLVKKADDEAYYNVMVNGKKVGTWTVEETELQLEKLPKARRPVIKVVYGGLLEDLEEAA